jgi:hypothetical protein
LKIDWDFLPSDWTIGDYLASGCAPLMSLMLGGIALGALFPEEPAVGKRWANSGHLGELG